jgi:hypothetical protein
VRLLHYFLGEPDDAAATETPLLLNPGVERPLKSLQVLFPHGPGGLGREPWRFRAALRNYHPWLLHARCEIDCTNPDAPFGLAGWDDHVIKLVGFASPLGADITARCVRSAHYAPDYKALALRHRAHVLLYYAGYATSPLEQYAALAAVAGALGSCGAVAVLNENAQTSLPADVLAARDFAGDRLELLRTLPIPTLYAGFLKYEIAGSSGVWMRTQGCSLMGLPDLAFLASGHHEGERVFDLFASVLNYLLVARAKLGAGHTMQLGNDWCLRVREPGQGESFLESAGELFVLETIGASAINQ